MVSLHPKRIKLLTDPDIFAADPYRQEPLIAGGLS
jgi:hypothetical protein